MSTNDTDPALVSQNKSFILFNLVTDYTTIALFLVKLFYAIGYAYSLLGQSRMDEEFLMDINGPAMQATRTLSKQRKALQYYYMHSITFQRFTIVQSVSLIWIFIDSLLISMKIFFVLAYSVICYFYLLGKMDELLEQMNE